MEDSGHLECDDESLGQWLPTFRKNVSIYQGSKYIALMRLKMKEIVSKRR
jgi:hypothetical protein